MAKFNPETPVVNPPSSVSASRGIPTNRAFETLFSGVGSAIGQTAGVIDEVNKINIENQIFSGVDQSATSAPNIFSDVTDAGPTDILPSGLESGRARIANLVNAKNQGVVSDTAFITRLDSISKRLRSQYPGYRKFIDNTIANAQGTSTANQLRRQQLRDIEEAQSNKNDATKKRDQLAKELSKEGILPANWEAMSNAELITYTNQQNVEQGANKREMSKLSLKKARGEANSEDAKVQLTKTLDHMWRRQFTHMSTASGKTFQELNKALDAAKSDGKITEEERVNLTTTFEAVNRRWQQTVQEIVRSPLDSDISDATFSSIINNPAEVNAIIEAGSQRLSIIQEAITNKDFGIIKYEANRIEAMQDDMLRGIASDPNTNDLFKASQLQKLLGADVFGIVMAEMDSKDRARLSGSVKYLLTKNDTEMISGEKGITESTLDLKRSGAPSQAYLAQTNAVISVLTSPNSSDEAVLNAANALFQQGEVALFNQFQEKDRPKILNKLITPAVTERMKKLGKINPDVFDNYQEYLRSVFPSVYRSRLQDIQATLEGDQFISVKWNPNILQFQVSSGTGVGQFNFPGFTALRGVNSISRARAISDINKFIQRFAPILKEEGMNNEDISNELLDLFAVAGVDTSTKPSEGLLQKMMDSMRNSANEARENFKNDQQGFTVPDDAVISPTSSNINTEALPEGREDIGVMIIDRFANAGLESHHQIAALANAIGESNLNPEAHNPRGEDSVGLFQLNRQGGLGSGFSREHLKNPENNINIILQAAMKSKNFREAKTLEEAVEAFVREVERPADKAGAIRKRLAIARKLASN